MILTPDQTTLALRARNAAQSAHPGLWRGLTGAWVPALGYQGDPLPDLSKRTGSLSFYNNPVWSRENGIPSIEFDSGLNHISRTKPAFPSIPCTMVSRVKLKNITTEQTFVSVAANDSSVNYFFLGAIPSRGWEYQVRTSSSFDSSGFAVANGGVIDTEWHTIAAVSEDTTTHKLYADGVLIDTDVNFASPTTMNVTALGLLLRSAASAPLNGFQAAAYTYNRALTQDEIIQFDDFLAPFRLRDDTALVTAAMFGGTTTPSVTLPPPLFNMQMTGSF